MTVVDPFRTDEEGWAFRDGRGYARDPINGFAFLREAYDANDPGYRGRVTVPVLWDMQTKRIVSNNDDSIMRAFETEFGAFAKRHVDLYPAEHRAEIDELNGLIFETVNDGVYRAGFATTQAAYETPVYRLFETLDLLDARLANRRYLFGARPVETDWRLFVTLVRFDPVYAGHFKCNLRRIADYPISRATCAICINSPASPRPSISSTSNDTIIRRIPRSIRRASYRSGRCSISTRRTVAND